MSVQTEISVPAQRILKVIPRCLGCGSKLSSGPLRLGHLCSVRRPRNVKPPRANRQPGPNPQATLNFERNRLRRFASGLASDRTPAGGLSISNRNDKRVPGELRQGARQTTNERHELYSRRQTNAMSTKAMRKAIPGMQGKSVSAS